MSEGAKLVVAEVGGGLVQSSVVHCGGVRTYGCNFLFNLWVKFDNGVSYCVIDFESAWRDVVVWYFGYEE